MSVNKVRTMSQDQWVWLTKSGWPVSGSNLGAAVPSVANAQVYWWEVMCQTCKSSCSSYHYPIRRWGEKGGLANVLDSLRDAQFCLHPSRLHLISVIRRRRQESPSTLRSLMLN